MGDYLTPDERDRGGHRPQDWSCWAERLEASHAVADEMLARVQRVLLCHIEKTPPDGEPCDLGDRYCPACAAAREYDAMIGGEDA